MDNLINIIDTTGEPNIIEQIMSKPQHGGRRAGAGRKPLSDENKLHRYDIYLHRHIMEAIGGKAAARRILENHYICNHANTKENNHREP